MLFDPKWEIPAVTDEPWRRALLEGATRIEKYGHIKGVCGNERDGFCLIGSMLHLEAWPEACNAVADFLGVCNAAVWNNAPERTPEDVCSIMRKVALHHS